jgi:hypothetical protein
MLYDIVFEIFKHLTTCTATCFGLISKLIYAELKRLYPEPIYLYQQRFSGIPSSAI